MPVPWAVIDAVTQEFGVELVSEYDHRYWGFATKKAWDDWEEQRAKESQDDFYNDLVHYVRDEPNDLMPNTIGMIKAEGGVAELVGIEGGVVSGVINLESSGVEASDWRPRHDEQYHEV
jgi:hypothetical protein